MVCCLLYLMGVGENLNFMMIGTIMPLVPGVAFTNSIRDVADGDYISGSVRMLDALLVFFCIAIGVGIGFPLFPWFREAGRFRKWDSWRKALEAGPWEASRCSASWRRKFYQR